MTDVLATATNWLQDLPVHLILALLILAGGWLVAYALATILRKALEKARLDARLAKWTGDSDLHQVHPTKVISKVVYYLFLLFAVIGFFRALGLSVATEPLSLMLNEIFMALPNVAAAISILAAAWIIASSLRFLIRKLLVSSHLDETLVTHAGTTDKKPIRFSDSLSSVIYWLVFLLFLPFVLSKLGLDGVLSPLQAMLERLLTYLPDAFGAALIFFFGWLFARIVKQIVMGLLFSMGAHRLGEQVGLKSVVGTDDIPTVIGNITYALILISVIIAGLGTLHIDAVSQPATEMLAIILSGIPSIFAAIVLLVVTYIVGRLVAGLVANILTSLGFNRVFKLLGLSKADFSHPESKTTPAKVVGTVALVTVMLFASMEAADVLGFTYAADLISEFMYFGGQVALGLIVFGIGLYFAHLAHRLILDTAGGSGAILAHAARVAIIVLSVAMGVRQMGIAEDIVNLAFALILGAVALAAAIAFGFGARDIAARELDGWLKHIREDEKR